MRNIFFIVLIVCSLVMLAPLLAAAGGKLRDKYKEIFFGGHDPEKVKELRDSNG